MKKKETQRSDRISEQIRRDLSVLIQREIKDPRVGMVSLTSVSITPDYAHAKVFFSLLDTDKRQSTEEALHHAAGFLRRELGRSLHIHTLPTLHFIYDDSLARGSAMDNLIAEALSRTADAD